jgi:hypothetical protein
MRLATRLAALAVLAVVALPWLAPTEASARTLSCSFRGVTGLFDPPIPPLTQTGGEGAYAFETDRGQANQCSLDGGPPMSASISSRGRYLNVRCNSGFWYGDQTTPSSTGNDTVIRVGPATITNIRYAVDFTGGLGAVHFSHLEGRSEIATGLKDVDGVIQLMPIFSAGNCALAPGVRQWEIAGAFTVEW